MGVSASDADGFAAGASERRPALQIGGPPGVRAPFDGYGEAVRASVLHEPRLGVSTTAHSTLPAFQLLPVPRGSFGSLTPVAVSGLDALKPGQVALDVKAVGLNFRWAMGQESKYLQAHWPSCLFA